MDVSIHQARRTRRRQLRVFVFAGALLLGLTYQASPALAQVAEWTPETLPALQLYRDSQYDEARQLCATLQRGSASADVRRDAFVIQLMCSLRSESRDEVTGARAYLLDLGSGTPAVLERGEVLLAMGVAHIKLHETSSALRYLSAAVERFAADNEPARQAMALAALTDAWAIHNEWETTPDLKGARPSTPVDAAIVRIAQIRAARATVEKLPAGEPARDHIDRVLAEMLLAQPAHEPEGQSILERLAARPIESDDIAVAALLLAERYELNSRSDDALALYRRIAECPSADLSARAAERIADLTRLQLVLDVADSIPPNQPWRPVIRARNAGAVHVEIRALDLAAWLVAQRGDFDDTRLPVSGRLLADWSVDVPNAQSMDWWHSDTADADTPEVSPEAGAYVVSAHAVGTDGAAVNVKRLVVASNLWAVVVTGTERAVVWCGHSTDTSPTLGKTARARFWMRGSFVPTEATIDGGIGEFRMPGEARLLLDKRWLCLIEDGQQITVCRGDVPRRSRAGARPTQVALVATSVAPQPGDALHLFGQLLGTGARPPSWANAAATIYVYDAMNELMHEQLLDVDETGLFEVDVPITTEMAGKVCRVAVDYAGEVLTNVRSRFTFRAASLNDTPLAITCDMPDRLPPGTRELHGTTTPRYPWGSAPLEPRVSGVLRALRLPTSDENGPPIDAAPFHFHVHAHDEGPAPFDIPLTDLGLPPGPIALGAWFQAVGDDGRSAWTTGRTLLGEKRIHAWILH
ncbi:MAG: hypothetical protein JXO22_13185, partial [Phycisphaerae bacterium]|nr:hypothetical protein [Phycisphaerae bacterium]